MQSRYGQAKSEASRSSLRAAFWFAWLCSSDIRASTTVHTSLMHGTSLKEVRSFVPTCWIIGSAGVVHGSPWPSRSSSSGPPNGCIACTHLSHRSRASSSCSFWDALSLALAPPSTGQPCSCFYLSMSSTELELTPTRQWGCGTLPPSPRSYLRCGTEGHGPQYSLDSLPESRSPRRKLHS